jgi:hypothetical protein
VVRVGKGKNNPLAFVGVFLALAFVGVLHQQTRLKRITDKKLSEQRHNIFSPLLVFFTNKRAERGGQAS